MIVLVVRNDLSAERIISMDGEDLLRYVVGNDLFGENIVQSRLTKVTVLGNVAKGLLVVDSAKNISFPIEMNKTSDKWRINFAELYRRLMPEIHAYLDKMITEGGMSHQEYLFEMIEDYFGTVPDSSI